MLSADFYAGQVAEYGQDVDQFAGVFAGCIRRGEVDEARAILEKLKYQAWLLTDAASNALSKVI